MLSQQDRENILGWAYVWLREQAEQTTKAAYCDVEAACCEDVAKVNFLIKLIHRSVGYLSDAQIGVLYQRLQCLIGLSAITTCPANCFPCTPVEPPTPTPTGCTLQVGGGCCDYSVEGIDLFANCFIVTFPEDLAFDEPSGGFGYFSIQANQFEFSNYPAIAGLNVGNITTLTPSINEILDALEESFNSKEFWNESNPDVFTFERLPFGFKICYTGEDFRSPITLSFEGRHNQGLNPYILDFNGEVVIIENQNDFTKVVEFALIVPDNQFQVLINDGWTTIPSDQINNGTWSTTSCDTITEWRIIDSEENVIDSGNVTATCEGSTQVTDSVCNWLQAHQTAIEQLQNNPTGLTCETLSDCQTIIDIQQDLADKANTADLATVATTGSYNDLTDTPTIPPAFECSDLTGCNVSLLTNDAGYQTAAQVSTAITSAKPVTVIGIDAGTTALTDSVTNGILGSVLIPANSLTLHTIVELEAFLSKTSPSASPFHRLWINSTNNLTGATQIAIQQGAAGTKTSKMERSFLRTSTGLTIFPATVSGGVDDTAVISVITTVLVDWTVDNYILHTANNASGETTTNVFLYLKKSVP